MERLYQEERGAGQEKTAKTGTGGKDGNGQRRSRRRGREGGKAAAEAAGHGRQRRRTARAQDWADVPSSPAASTRSPPPSSVIFEYTNEYGRI